MTRCEVVIGEHVGDVLVTGYSGACTHRQREVRKLTPVDLAESLSGSGVDRIIVSKYFSEDVAVIPAVLPLTSYHSRQHSHRGTFAAAVRLVGTCGSWRLHQQHHVACKRRVKTRPTLNTFVGECTANNAS